MKRLSKDQVIAMHKVLLQKTGGLEGIRDDGGLESALEAPFRHLIECLYIEPLK